ncbi:hypothetical protein TCAL_08248 [Tigriopus californicus]|uniref:CDC20/Fizzy WD40 domain-containing protein n=1 Tax=Tigriopus californicus TaxID=6832 RepID=A0A553NZX1_TIGCA|nr:cell division cycle protein 20 homolog [Tigriopus californicus]TRY70981.1 hypothetical protein TCAL_08248 [Tigriopus californicus]
MSSQAWKFQSDLSSITRMDVPLKSACQPHAAPAAATNKGGSAPTGPAAASSMNRSGLNTSSLLNASRLNASSRFNPANNGSFSMSHSLLSTSAGPGSKRLSESIRKTPSKTPKNSPGRKENLTPGRKTPGGGPQDRFIPARQANDLETSHFRLMRSISDQSQIEAEATLSPSKREYRRQMSEALTGSELDASARIISYTNKAPKAPETHANGLKVLYTQPKTPGSVTAKKYIRHIPQVPERILDAPEIMNDYYLNLLDWSANNHLAVALGGHIYLWNASNGEIQQLCEMDSVEDYVCSVKWIKEGNILAVGNSAGDVALWDVEHLKRIRLMSGHTDRVASLSWNSYIVSSGSRSGQIHHGDVRVADHLVGQLEGHTQEVCGLAWSPDGKMLASGGNDNLLNVWSAAHGECFTDATPKYSFSHHQAAVKALAWCPWQPNVLASGGGTADRTIRIWNCNNGTSLHSVDTKSQVCALLWSKEYKELVSSHGFANNEISIWKYPTMTKVAELFGHTERVLHLSMSPDGSTIVSGGADETLRLWKCFQPDPSKKKQEIQSKSGGSKLISRAGIR